MMDGWIKVQNFTAQEGSYICCTKGLGRHAFVWAWLDLAARMLRACACACVYLCWGFLFLLFRLSKPWTYIWIG